MIPPAGNGAELQLAFAPSKTPEVAGFNLVLQIAGGLEERGFQRAVSGLGMQGRPMNEQCPLARMVGGLGVRTWAGHLQPDLDAERRLGLVLVFEDYFGSGDRRQTMQVFELFLHLTVPGGLGVETEIAKSSFHIRSGMGLWLRRAQRVLYRAPRARVPVPGTGDLARPCGVSTHATLTSMCCGFALAVLAKCTASTPSLNSALTCAGLASSGIEKLRTKLP